jgi:hypothetical protein
MPDRRWPPITAGQQHVPHFWNPDTGCAHTGCPAGSTVAGCGFTEWCVPDRALITALITVRHQLVVVGQQPHDGANSRRRRAEGCFAMSTHKIRSQNTSKLLSRHTARRMPGRRLVSP